MIRIILAAVLSLVALSAQAKIPSGSGATYYISATGSDSNSGTSQDKAWQTLAKLNSTTFNCGDTVLLQGGAKFTPTAQINISTTIATPPGKFSAACSPLNPFTLASYGNGRATITYAVTTNDLIYVSDMGGVVIHDLILVGPNTGVGAGISFFNDQTTLYDFGYIYNMDVSFFQNGVAIGGGGSVTLKGFKNVSVMNSRLHHNCANGFLVYGFSTSYNTNQNIFVDRVQADNNTGACGTNSDGSGIEVGSATGVTVRRSVTNNNGSGTVSGTRAPAGLWGYLTNGGVFEYNESYLNCGGLADGDGIDIDGANLNHLAQYNYSHDNCGSGVLAWQYSGAQPWGWNTIRYNITQNNGTAFSYGEFVIGAASSAQQVGYLSVYGNTFRTVTSGKPAVAFITGIAASAAANLYNNIFSSASPSSALMITNSLNPSAYIFQGNDWDGGLTNVNWNGTAYSTIALWRAGVVTQETFRGADTSLISNPSLASVGNGGTCYASGIPAGPQSCPSAYILQAGSPMLNAGQNIFNFTGALAGGRDYYGNIVPAANGNYDVGANQRTQ